MRIGIDVRYLSHGLLGGVHTYVANLVPEIIKIATKDEIFLYADTKHDFELSHLPDEVTVRFLPWRNGLSSIYNDLFMRKVMHQDQIEIAHFPTNYGFGPPRAQTIITLHDEINILPLLEIYRGHQKNFRNLSLMTYLHLCSRHSLRNAKIILTVSNYSKKQIKNYSSIDPNQIIVIPEAHTSEFHLINDEHLLKDVRVRHRINKPFILADLLKNPYVITRAWKLLPAEILDKYEILFYSRIPDYPPIIQEFIKDGFARVLYRPSRSDLIALYNMAEVFIFPSWIEGFGLPLLEAMACGAPVIASDRGSIPEVAGNAALIMDAEDDQTLSEYLTRVLSSTKERYRLRELGLQRVAQFSWSRTAKETLGSYEFALSL
jgi:glycosyltransferase involved in cell wall biosynthesis